MPIASRRKTIAFFVALGVCLVALAVALNVGWIILNRREAVLLFFGVIFFAAIIGGMIVNTSFLVREIRRNEQHDSFINAVTHELKTPIASIRLYLETLQRRELDEEQRQKFYRLMLLDSTACSARSSRCSPRDKAATNLPPSIARTLISKTWSANAWTSRVRATTSMLPDCVTSRASTVQVREARNRMAPESKFRAIPKNFAPQFRIFSTTPSNIPSATWMFPSASKRRTKNTSS